MDKEIINQLIKILEFVQEVVPETLRDEFGDECIPELLKDLNRR